MIFVEDLTYTKTLRLLLLAEKCRFPQKLKSVVRYAFDQHFIIEIVHFESSLPSGVVDVGPFVTVVFCKVPTMPFFPLIDLNSRINGTRIMPLEDKCASWC